MVDRSAVQCCPGRSPEAAGLGSGQIVRDDHPRDDIGLHCSEGSAVDSDGHHGLTVGTPTHRAVDIRKARG